MAGRGIIDGVSGIRRAGYRISSVLIFASLHASLVAVVWAPFSRSALLWLLGTYAIRMFGVTAGYHRYFSHRSYRLGRWAQLAMAVLAQSSGQRGVLWWAAHHRRHHRESDRERDVHSPVRHGFWWAHLGWILSSEFDRCEAGEVGELERYSELRWLDRHHWAPAIGFGAAVAVAGGWPAFVWGFLVSTALLYHCTFAINSLAHLWGTRRFETTDGSRNNWLLALLTFGEGWHNNHHHSPGSCRQGERWWELDITYGGLRLLSWLGIARDLRPFRAGASGRVTPGRAS